MHTSLDLIKESACTKEFITTDIHIAPTINKAVSRISSIYIALSGVLPQSLIIIRRLV